MNTSAHCFFFIFLLLSSLLFIIFCNLDDLHSHRDSSLSQMNPSFLADRNQILTPNFEQNQPRSTRRRRKLLMHERCNKRDISISQSKAPTSGIPQFIVQIANTCLSDCAPPSNIHLHCGWFASAKIVNPKIFKRVFYDDCVVNGGKPLEISQTIRFTYSNSFMYPLAFKSATFS